MLYHFKNILKSPILSVTPLPPHSLLHAVYLLTTFTNAHRIKQHVEKDFHKYCRGIYIDTGIRKIALHENHSLLCLCILYLFPTFCPVNVIFFTLVEGSIVL